MCSKTMAHFIFEVLRRPTHLSEWLNCLCHPTPSVNWPHAPLALFNSPKTINHFNLRKALSGHTHHTLRAMSSATISPLLLLPVLLVLLSVFGCHATPPSQHSRTEENVLLEELVREVRKLNDRMDSVLGRGGAAEEEELIVEGKRSPQGMAPSVLWNGAGDKRAQLPFSGGIYGKRSPLPFSGGIYGKRSSSHQLYRSPLIFPTLDRQTRAMPFNGGMYGK